MAFRDRAESKGAPRQKPRRSSSRGPSKPLVLAPPKVGVFAQPKLSRQEPVSRRDRVAATKKVQAAEERLPGTTLPVKRLPTLAHPTHKQAEATVREQRKALAGVSIAAKQSAARGNADRVTREQVANAQRAERKLSTDALVKAGVREARRDPAAYGFRSVDAPGMSAPTVQMTPQLTRIHGKIKDGDVRGAFALIGAMTRARGSAPVQARERAPHGAGAGLSAVAGLHISKGAGLLAQAGTGAAKRAAADALKGTGAGSDENVLKHGVQDLVHFPYDAVNAGGQIAQAGADLAKYLPHGPREAVAGLLGIPAIGVTALADVQGGKGSTKRAKAIAGSVDDGALGALVTGHPGLALKRTGEHPLYAASEVSGAYSAAGRLLGAGVRGAGAAARVGGKGERLRALGDLRRPDLVLEPGARGLRVDRSLSKNLLTALGQRARDRGLVKQGLGSRNAKGEIDGIAFRGSDRKRARLERQAVHEFADTQQNVGRSEREAMRRAGQSSAGRRGVSARQRAEQTLQAGLAELRAKGVSKPERMSAVDLAKVAERHGVTLVEPRGVRARAGRGAAAARSSAKVRAERMVPTKIAAPMIPFTSGRAGPAFRIRPERELLVPAAKQLIGDIRSSLPQVAEALRGEVTRLDQAFETSSKDMGLAGRRANRNRVGAMKALLHDIESGKRGIEGRVAKLMGRGEEYRRVAANVSRKMVEAGLLTADQAKNASLMDYAMSRFADEGVGYSDRRAPTDADAATYAAAQGKARGAAAQARGAGREARRAREQAIGARGGARRAAGQRRARKLKPGERGAVVRPNSAEFTPGSRPWKDDRGQRHFTSGKGSLTADGQLHTWFEGEETHAERFGHGGGREDFLIRPDGEIRVHGGSGRLTDEQIVARAITQDPRLKVPKSWGIDKPERLGGMKESWDAALAEARGAAPRPVLSKAEAKAARKAQTAQALQRRAASAELWLLEERQGAAIAAAKKEHGTAGKVGDELRAAVATDPVVRQSTEALKLARKRLGKVAAKTKAERRADAMWLRERTMAAKAQAARKTAAEARAEVVKPREFVRGLELGDGSKLTQQAIEERFRREYGKDAALPAFVSAQPAAGGSGAYFVNWLSRSLNRKSADTHRKTGRAEQLGISDASEQGAIDALVHSQGVLSAAQNWDRFVGAFGIRIPGEFGRKSKLTPWERAEEYAKALNEGQNAELGRGPYAPVRVAPSRYDEPRIAEIVQRQGAADAEHPKGVLSGIVQEMMRRPGDEADLKMSHVVLVPERVLAEFEKHQGVSTSEVAGLGRAYTNAFRSTVLPLSTKWLFGNVAEGVLRLGVAGAHPADVMLGRRFVRDLLAHDVEAGQLLQTRAQNGLLYGSSDRLNAKAGGLLDGTALEGASRGAQAIRNLPVVKQAIDGYMGFAHLVFTFNKWVEQQMQAAVIGKEVRRRVAEDTQSWAKSWQVAMGHGHGAYRDALEGAVGTASQVRFARAVDATLGKYSRFSPTMRRATQVVAPFLPWYANALRFVYWTLPVGHPALTALMTTVERQFDADMKAQSGALPPGDLGANPHARDGGIYPVTRYTPFGAFTGAGREAQMAADEILSPLLPQISGAFNAMHGMDAFGRKASISDGSAPARLQLALYSMLEGFLPAAQIARRLREQGDTGFTDSTFWAPKRKVGTAHGRSAAGRIFNPLEETYLQPKGGEVVVSPGPTSARPAGGGDPRMAKLSQLQGRLKVTAADPRMAKLAALQASGR